jgi:mRNA interferase RelE/StbE
VGSYRILIKASASRELEKVSSKKNRQRVTSKISQLAENPRPDKCEKLSGQSARYRIRQGDYRIVYSVNDADREVTIVKIGHRRDVYR